MHSMVWRAGRAVAAASMPRKSSVAGMTTSAMARLGGPGPCKRSCDRECIGASIRPTPGRAEATAPAHGAAARHSAIGEAVPPSAAHDGLRARGARLPAYNPNALGPAGTLRRKRLLPTHINVQALELREERANVARGLLLIARRIAIAGDWDRAGAAEIQHPRCPPGRASRGVRLRRP